MSIPEIRLKKKLMRDSTENSSIHPWIFSGAIATEPEGLLPGSMVKVFDLSAGFLGYGHYNPLSSIRVRIISRKEKDVPDIDFFKKKIVQAFELRKKSTIHSDSFRIIFSESDYLPGLVVDKFGDYAVMQTNSAGMDALKTELARIIADVCEVRGVVERNDCEIRKLEGLPLVKGLLFGEEPPDELIIEENGLNFAVSLLKGQKTGFFLDQRENRAAVANFARPGMKMLDAFCFSGAFGTYCASKGISSLHLLDESENALSLAKKNLGLNRFAGLEVNSHQGDAFSLLRKFRDSRTDFDFLVLDPPKFAPTRKDADRAARGYKDINILAMKLLRNGGYLATFSCSSGISRERFRDILFNAARDSAIDLVILATLGHAVDHPIRISFPESEYLKGFICEIRK